MHCPYVKELFHINPNVPNFRDAKRFGISDSNLIRTLNAPITLISKYANIVNENIYISMLLLEIIT